MKGDVQHHRALPDDQATIIVLSNDDWQRSPKSFAAAFLVDSIGKMLFGQR